MSASFLMHSLVYSASHASGLGCPLGWPRACVEQKTKNPWVLIKIRTDLELSQ